jgi:hypothetical protein
MSLIGDSEAWIYSSATEDQRRVILSFVSGRDVFVSLPTGAGVSLCYTPLLYLFDFLRVRISPDTAAPLKHSSIAVVRHHAKCHRCHVFFD